MIELWTLPLVAFIVSVVFSVTTIWVTVYGLHDKANADYVRQLEARVERTEKALEECERKNARLSEENFDFMRRLVHVENVTGARDLPTGEK